MSDKFPRLVVKPVRTNLSWHGRFREPVFRVFTNPAAAYAALHRYLQPFGGQIADIGVETTVLSSAYITYSLLADGGPIVRLRLERLEVAFLDWGGDSDSVGRFVDGLRAELRAADEGLEPTQAEVSLDMWASVASGSYDEWAAILVTRPDTFSAVPSRVTLHGPTWSVGFEPAARFTAGLYIRYTNTYAADVAAAMNVDEITRDLWATLREFGVTR